MKNVWMVGEAGEIGATFAESPVEPVEVRIRPAKQPVEGPFTMTTTDQLTYTHPFTPDTAGEHLAVVQSTDNVKEPVLFRVVDDPTI